MYNDYNTFTLLMCILTKAAGYTDVYLLSISTLIYYVRTDLQQIGSLNVFLFEANIMSRPLVAM